MGYGLVARFWPAAQPRARASVLIAHGMGEHSGRYQPLAQVLNKAGYHVLAPDLRGHGVHGRRVFLDAYLEVAFLGIVFLEFWPLRCVISRVLDSFFPNSVPLEGSSGGQKSVHSVSTGGAGVCPSLAVRACFP